MGDYSTPFSKSPPYVQLIMLLFFNTAIFLGSALIQKAFSVDILPIVASMTGAGPMDTLSGKKVDSNQRASPFGAFTKSCGTGTTKVPPAATAKPTP